MRPQTSACTRACFFSLCALLLCYAPQISAQSAAGATAATTTASAPVRLRLDSLQGLAAKAGETVDINLEGAALQLATQVAGSNEILKNLPPGIDQALVRELLGSMQGVYVRVFQFKQPGAYTEANVEPILSQLRASGSGWSSLFAVNQPGGSQVNFFAANDSARNDRLSGIALLVREPKQLVVGYVVGSIDSDTVMKVMQIFQSMNAPKNPAPNQSAKPAQGPPAPKNNP